MDCMQFLIFKIKRCRKWVSIPQAVWIACNDFDDVGKDLPMQFQYRKRYGLHAMKEWIENVMGDVVSIPQAVWIACNKYAAV